MLCFSALPVFPQVHITILLLWGSVIWTPGVVWSRYLSHSHNSSPLWKQSPKIIPHCCLCQARLWSDVQTPKIAHTCSAAGVCYWIGEAPVRKDLRTWWAFLIDLRAYRYIVDIHSWEVAKKLLPWLIRVPKCGSSLASLYWHKDVRKLQIKLPL